MNRMVISIADTVSGLIDSNIVVIFLWIIRVGTENKVSAMQKRFSQKPTLA